MDLLKGGIIFYGGLGICAALFALLIVFSAPH